MTEETTKKIEQATENVAKEAIGIGRMWAEVGLQIGKTALETAVVTLNRLVEVVSDKRK